MLSIFHSHYIPYFLHNFINDHLLSTFGLSCIQNMLILCHQHVHEFLYVKRRIKHLIKLELLNREESYNKIFGNTPKIK